EALEPGQNLDGTLRVLHDERFGDLELESAFRHRIARKHQPDLLKHVLAEELTARLIDADEKRVAIARQHSVPARRLLEGLAQHIVADVYAHICLFGSQAHSTVH